uniref:Right handed beta helix domain-containing protein n=1 Tax=Vannella robusta TaxID=1487602 RepID=A0A7S4HLB1_9EUKA
MAMFDGTRLLRVLIFVCCLCSFVRASDYYVSLQALPDGNCTKEAPCTSLYDVFALVSSQSQSFDDDVDVYFNGGTYQGSQNINVVFPTNRNLVSLLKWSDGGSTESLQFHGNGELYCFAPYNSFAVSDATIYACQTAIYLSSYVDLTLTNVQITGQSQNGNTGVHGRDLDALELNSCGFSSASLNAITNSVYIDDSTFYSADVLITASAGSASWFFQSSHFDGDVSLTTDTKDVQISDCYFNHVSAVSDTSSTESLQISNSSFNCDDAQDDTDQTGLTVDDCNMLVVENSSFSSSCITGINGVAANFTMANCTINSQMYGVKMKSSQRISVNGSSFIFPDDTGTSDLYSLYLTTTSLLVPVHIYNSTFVRTEVGYSYAAISITGGSQDANVTITDCKFNETIALDMGVGGYLSCSDTTVNVTESNSYQYYNSDTYAFSSQSQVNMTFVDCTFHSPGLGAINSPYFVSVSNCSFYKCSTYSRGGAMAIDAGCSINHSNFTSCTSGAGGALYMTAAQGSLANIQNSVFDSNYARNDGGAIYLDNDYYCIYLSLENSTFSNNVADSGSVMYCYEDDDCGEISITNGALEDNYSIEGDDITCSYNKSTTPWGWLLLLIGGSCCLLMMIVATIGAGWIASKQMNANYEPIK